MTYGLVPHTQELHQHTTCLVCHGQRTGRGNANHNILHLQIWQVGAWPRHHSNIGEAQWGIVPTPSLSGLPLIQFSASPNLQARVSSALGWMPSLPRWRPFNLPMNGPTCAAVEVTRTRCVTFIPCLPILQTTPRSSCPWPIRNLWSKSTLRSTPSFMHKWHWQHEQVVTYRNHLLSLYQRVRHSL